MITKWKVYNFKSIREETELELGPLTIFAGANSSGKSTFIQSILLIAQTLSHKVSSRSVVLNGALTSLGQFDDLRSNGSESDQIVIACTCKPIQDREHLQRSANSLRRGRSGPIQKVSYEIAFDADPSSAERDFYQIQPRLFASQLNSCFRDRQNIDQHVEMSVVRSNKALSSIEGIDVLEEIDELRGSLEYDVVMDAISLQDVHEESRSAEAIGCTFRHFLPEKIVYRINGIKEEAKDITKLLQDSEHDQQQRSLLFDRVFFLPREVLAVLRNILLEIVDIEAVYKEKKKRSLLFDDRYIVITSSDWREFIASLSSLKQYEIRHKLHETADLFEQIHNGLQERYKSAARYSFDQNNPPSHLLEAIEYLDIYFATSVKYLGPLRDAPKPLYPLAPAADPDDVGLKGEHTAAVLELHKNKLINYIPSSSFSTPAVNTRAVTRSLEAAVIDWVQYLGVASSVKSQDKGKLGHELKVSLGDTESIHDLTHVGVGVSQVLPILVMCLLAEPDSVLVFEQPELHLHPKVQTLLGDFFLSMALCNKQCIVETHSEYLIDRLRFRIAASPSFGSLKDLSKIYFVEKPAANSTFREVIINEYGAITHWPEGFFDQSQREAEEILRAATLKRKQSVKKSNYSG